MQTKPVVTIQGPKTVAPEGLRDGGHVYLACSNCQAGLMDFWVTRPDEIDEETGKVVQWKVQCNCPFCGDESFQADVVGGFYPAGYGILKPGSDEDTIDSTQWESHDIKGGVIYFKVMKASKDAKPIKLRR